ncbi:hypothetical protein BSIN_2097 [Burkholderia singularis]|uniref:Uncharacterized protein n=1 Tax=Burkholderia singularis TaxID=1503053 RepID=A0A238H0N0_9BURK|nr:hypothetical protein BSIN_2097 [Burkholderia singularis]
MPGIERFRRLLATCETSAGAVATHVVAPIAGNRTMVDIDSYRLTIPINR